MAGVESLHGSFLERQDYNRAACRATQEEALSNLMLVSEAQGQVSLAPFQSPTPRPALEGFSCPNTPPALRIGDYVSVVTDGLWLRSEPRAADNTRVRKFLHYAPNMIRFIGGPVCEKYVYWQVQVVEFGEPGITTQGWLVEGDPQETYLVTVK